MGRTVVYSGRGTNLVGSGHEPCQTPKSYRQACRGHYSQGYLDNQHFKEIEGLRSPILSAIKIVIVISILAAIGVAGYVAYSTAGYFK
jgi:hypothetical protein